MDTAYKEVERLLEQIRTSCPGKVAEAACDQLQVLCRGYMTEDPLQNMPVWAHGLFSKREMAFVSLLLAREGHVVAKAALLDALYYAEPEEAGEKILSVFAFRIRRKLRGTGYKLETIWGIGWRIVKSGEAAAIDPIVLRRQLIAQNQSYALKTADRMMAA